MSGGGGGSTTTSNELDPDIKRAVLPAIQRSARLYGSGDFERVADQEGIRGALAGQRDRAQKIAEEGLGQGRLLNELKKEEGRLLSGQQGALGSARADRAREAALVDRDLQLTQADQAARRQAGADATGAERGILDLEQFKIDAPVRGTERYFGALAGAPQASSTTTKQGGGK